MKSRSVFALAGLIGVFAVLTGTAHAQQPVSTYRVTIQNLTTGQPFSPPIAATHAPSIRMFEVGAAASPQLQEIAENGNPEPMATLLAGLSGVSDTAVLGGPILPGQSATLLIAARAGDVLSLSTMLICTNDGFTGVSAVALGSGSQTVSRGAYDAGTEANTEDTADIVDPCGAAGPVAHPADGNGRTAESGVVAMHPGIAGTGDLTTAHGWTGDVVRVTVEKVETVRYTVTIKNNTTGQPFSPPAIVAHTSAASLFTPGSAASSGIQAIAENGDTGPLVAALSTSPAVYQVVALSAPILPGASATATINAPRGALISVATMLICTNDAFTGVNSVALGSGSQSLQANAYDAGTEANTELTADIVDPCGAAGPVAHPADGNGHTAEQGVIAMHPGIRGGAGLTNAHAWTNPVATITVSDSAAAPAPSPTAPAPNAPSTGSGLAGTGGAPATTWLFAAGLLAVAAAAGLALRTRSRRPGR